MRDEAEIEGLVRERQSAIAVPAIQAFWKRNKHAARQRCKAADWLRRLGLYSEALHCLSQERFKSPGGLNQDSALEIVMLARILNFLGASSFALQRVEKLTREAQGALPGDARAVVGGIFLSNYRFVEAETHFHAALAASEPGSYTHGLRSVSLADARSGEGHGDEACEIVRRVGETSTVDSLKLICLTAEGEYLVKLGRTDAAFARLGAAEAFLKAEDRSTDAAIWAKWMGAASLARGDFAAAQSLFQRSFDLFFQPQHKPEAWLEVLWWMGEARLRQFPGGGMPQEWLRVLCYPAVPGPLLAKLEEGLAEDCVRISGASFRCAEYPRAAAEPEPWLLDRLSCTERRGTNFRLEERLSGKLIEILARAGSYGVPRFRLLEQLWPQERLAFTALDVRLKNLLAQTRKAGLRFEVRAGSVRLAEDGPRPVLLWHPRRSIPGLAWLKQRGNATFRRVEVEAAFGLGRTQAGVLLRNWTNSGLVSRQGPRGEAYAVVGSPSQMTRHRSL